MGRFQRSMALAKASANVLKADKELVLLPVLSMIATIIAAISFLVPVWATRHESLDAFNNTTHTSITPIGYVLIFLMYVVLAYITIFFNTALITAADERMRGGNPNLKTAIAGATSRAGAILPWAIVSATVSVVLRAVEQRAGILGRIVIGLVGMAWTVVTFMVLPVIVFEKLSVGKAVKRSGELFKSTWGENLIGNGGIGLVSLLAVLAGVPVLLLCLATKATPVVVAGIIAFAVWVLFVSAVTTALTGVYQVALYRFATDGQAPSQFASVDMAGAFRNKGSGRRSGGFGSFGGGGGSGFGGGNGGGSDFGQPTYPPPAYPPPSSSPGQGWAPGQGAPQYPPPAGPESPGWGAPPADR